MLAWCVRKRKGIPLVDRKDTVTRARERETRMNAYREKSIPSKFLYGLAKRRHPMSSFTATGDANKSNASSISSNGTTLRSLIQLTAISAVVLIDPSHGSRFLQKYIYFELIYMYNTSNWRPNIASILI